MRFSCSYFQSSSGLMPWAIASSTVLTKAYDTSPVCSAKLCAILKPNLMRGPLISSIQAFKVYFFLSDLSTYSRRSELFLVRPRKGRFYDRPYYTLTTLGFHGSKKMRDHFLAYHKFSSLLAWNGAREKEVESGRSADDLNDPISHNQHVDHSMINALARRQISFHRWYFIKSLLYRYCKFIVKRFVIVGPATWTRANPRPKSWQKVAKNNKRQARSGF
jgi:hypothetical protein